MQGDAAPDYASLHPGYRAARLSPHCNPVASHVF